jgi:hypothetical protein
VQSPAIEHILLLTHLLQLPPQSTSVSLPFLMLSPQLDGWHFAGDPEHTPF